MVPASPRAALPRPLRARRATSSLAALAAAVCASSALAAAPPMAPASTAPGSKLIIGVIVGIGLGLLTVAGVGLLAQRRR